MLQKNPLSPPRPTRTGPSSGWPAAAARLGVPFLSAEDFDGTGILAGVDPCESRYWWIPEPGPIDADSHAVDHAASRERPAATTAA